MIPAKYEEFINDINRRVSESGIDIEQLKIDHIGYQASSSSDYEEKVNEIKDETVQISESIVGGRRVGIFKLTKAIIHSNNEISYMEIIEPKEGQIVGSAWEHVEFLVASSLEDFAAQHPAIEWDMRAIDREEFPMLVLALGDGLSAKFPRRGVEEEVARQKGLIR